MNNNVSFENALSAADNIAYLAACMVDGKKPDAERISGMDLEKLYYVAEIHKMAGIVGYALESAGISDPAFVQAKGKAIRKIILFDFERRKVLEELEKAGIWYMPLKGCLLKDYYPQIGMREMADNDILYDRTRSMDVRSIMENLGFKTVKYVHDQYRHDVYQKSPVFNFEMHRALFGPVNDRLFKYYQEHLKEKMIRNEAESCGFHLSPEDFYIYMTAHEYKHYSNGGTGLRSLLDIYVYIQKVQMDMRYVYGELEKLGMLDHEAVSRSLALHLFGGEPLAEKEKEMLEYILSSGAYGKKSNRLSNKIRSVGRLRTFLSRLTLPYYLMVQNYPILIKAPVLYPFCWVHRLVYAFIFKHKIIMHELKTILTWKEKSGKKLPAHESA